jgi:3-hydroxyisobutyrate dehydrogenase-like beta-hydroxyacid dehydrogenase
MTERIGFIGVGNIGTPIALEFFMAIAQSYALAERAGVDPRVLFDAPTSAW